jgi:hypothetical protein
LLDLEGVDLWFAGWGRVTRFGNHALKCAVLPALLAIAACSGGSSAPPMANPSTAPSFAPPSLSNVQRISADPFSNGGSQHATEVEPSVASFGNTIVAAFQTGRFFGLGSSDIGFATSLDAGMSWHAGTLPGTTHYTFPPGPYDSISDPSVAYDAAHATWLIAGLPVFFDNTTGAPGVVVARSQDGLTWSNPIGVTAPDETTNDKSWIACDNHPASSFFGRCYVEWDSYNASGSIFMSVSSDGGTTWSAALHPTSSTSGGIGGQPVVQPNGTVIVPIDDANTQRVLAFRSANGGSSWTQPVVVASIADHLVAGNVRSLPLISAASDASGNVYVVWQDCRFRTACASNDLVMSMSSSGSSWTSPARIPIDPRSSGVDHFIPGVSVEPGTSGASAHVGITYYSFSDTKCTAATCRLFANFIASSDGGSTWNTPHTLVGPMNLGWLAETQDGVMVGDYMASTFVLGRAFPVFAVANPMRGFFDEAMYVAKNGIISAQSLHRLSSAGELPVPGFHSDHAPRHIHP